MDIESLPLSKLVEYSTVQRYIKKELKKIIADTGKLLKESYSNNMKPPNKSYTRTGDVYKAFFDSPGKIKLVVNEDSIDDVWPYDVSKIHPSSSGSRYKFNHHMSWDESETYKGEYIPRIVPVWLDTGFTVVGSDGTRHKFKGLHYVEDALGTDNVIEYIQNLVIESIKKYSQVVEDKIKETYMIQ